MKIEKTIREQARNVLNGNWVSGVVALFILFGVFIMIELIAEILLYSANVYDSNGMLKSSHIPYFIGVMILCIAAFVTASPIINGFLKFFYQLTTDKNSDLNCVLYFFRGTIIYFKTICFNILVIGKLIVYFAIGFIPYFLLNFLDGIFDLFPTVLAEEISFVIYTVLFGIGITVGIILSVKTLLINFIYVDDDSKSVGSYFTGDDHKFANKHYKDFIILTFTFIPWFALCFFVLPCIYVIPYYTEALATSAKWLIKLHKDGQKL